MFPSQLSIACFLLGIDSPCCSSPSSEFPVIDGLHYQRYVFQEFKSLYASMPVPVWNISLWDFNRAFQKIRKSEKQLRIMSGDWSSLWPPQIRNVTTKSPSSNSHGESNRTSPHQLQTHMKLHQNNKDRVHIVQTCSAILSYQLTMSRKHQFLFPLNNLVDELSIYIYIYFPWIKISCLRFQSLHSRKVGMFHNRNPRVTCSSFR